MRGAGVGAQPAVHAVAGAEGLERFFGLRRNAHHGRFGGFSVKPQCTRWAEERAFPAAFALVFVYGSLGDQACVPLLVRVLSQ